MLGVEHGEVAPETNTEMIFGMVSIMAAQVTLAALICGICNLFLRQRQKQKFMQDRMELMNYYMTQKQVGSELKFAINHYLMRELGTSYVYDRKELIECKRLLTESLQ